MSKKIEKLEFKHFNNSNIIDVLIEHRQKINEVIESFNKKEGE